jgi:hypothetical protein
MMGRTNHISDERVSAWQLMQSSNRSRGAAFSPQTAPAVSLYQGHPTKIGYMPLFHRISASPLTASNSNDWQRFCCYWASLLPADKS